jgi:hypothetical protein
MFGCFLFGAGGLGVTGGRGFGAGGVGTAPFVPATAPFAGCGCTFSATERKHTGDLVDWVSWPPFGCQVHAAHLLAAAQAAQQLDQSDNFSVWYLLYAQSDASGCGEEVFE